MASRRNTKKVLRLDATSYAVKQSWDFTSRPNSLQLSDDGKTLFVTLKTDFNKDYSTKGLDSIARIKLD